MTMPHTEPSSCTDWKKALEVAVACAFGDTIFIAAASQIGQLTQGSNPLSKVAGAFAIEIISQRENLRRERPAIVTLDDVLNGNDEVAPENWQPVVDVLIDLGLQVTSTEPLTWSILPGD